MSEYLGKLIYLTKAQYNTLAGGGTVGSLTGLNNNYLYYTTDENLTAADLSSNFLLPVEKGGTGKTQFTTGSLLVGNGTGALTEIAATNQNTGNTIVQRNASGDFSAGTITLTKLNNLTSINTTGGNGLLAYKPSSWTGVTSSQWGIGTIDIQGVIRSSNSDLLHSRAGTSSVILDASNYTTYTVKKDGTGATGNWNINAATATKATKDGDNNTITSTYVKKAGDTMTGTLTVPTVVGAMSKSITIGGKSYDGSADVDIDISDLGLAGSSMEFKGIITNTLTDGGTTSPVTLENNTSLTPAEGNVVIDAGGKEYIWTNGKWSNLGLATDFALSEHKHGNLTNAGKIGTASGQAVYTTTGGLLTVGSLATSNPTASGNATSFIDSISQDAKGKITVTKKNLDTSGTWSGNAATATTATTATTAGNVTGTVAIANGGTGQTTLTNARQALNSIEYIRGTWTAATNVWTGVSTDSALYEGKQIILYMPFAGNSNGATLNLTLSGGGTTGAVNVYFESTTRFTTHKGQYSQLHLIYHVNHSINGTNYTGWWYIANRDINDGNLYAKEYTLKAQTAITAGHIIGGTDSGYNHIDAGTAFDIRYQVLYANGAINAGSTNSNNFAFHYAINIKNSSNNNITLTAYKNVYIKGTISGNIFTPISGGNPYVQDITAADDGYVYYQIGRAYNTSAMTFNATGRDIYIYKNSAIQKWAGYSANSVEVIRLI